ncbi:MAG: hypothetical protein IT424_08335 [Pirellulales bacterium]|nr:hypothetical protein [Pirellulales bacterium]
MTISGHVVNGSIIPDEAIVLPDGAAVKIQVISDPTTSEDADSDDAPSLLERLAGVVGAIDNLPPDAARNVDHYLYGAPKR